jgi:chlorophyll synthase
MKSLLLVVPLILAALLTTAFSPVPCSFLSEAVSSSSSTPRQQQRSSLSVLPTNNNDKKRNNKDKGTSNFYPLLTAMSTHLTTTTRLGVLAPKSNWEISKGSADLRQLLGVNRALLDTTVIWKIHLQLTKPVMWIPLVWGVMCGATGLGNYNWIWNPFDLSNRNVLLGLKDTLKGFVAMILAGPFLTWYTQTINNWYNRKIDVINEPYHPIPSGAISEGQVIFQI